MPLARKKVLKYEFKATSVEQIDDPGRTLFRFMSADGELLEVTMAYRRDDLSKDFDLPPQAHVEKMTASIERLLKHVRVRTGTPHQYLQMLGKHADRVLAQRFGVTERTVLNHRKALGIASCRSHG